MFRRALALLPILLSTALPLAAQGATGDQARLIFSFYGGYVPGRDLWTVNGQPLVDDELGVTDVLLLDRDLGNTWTGGLGVTYFKGSNIGLTADLTVIATSLSDSCQMLSNSGSAIIGERRTGSMPRSSLTPWSAAAFHWRTCFHHRDKNCDGSSASGVRSSRPGPST